MGGVNNIVLFYSLYNSSSMVYVFGKNSNAHILSSTYVISFLQILYMWLKNLGLMVTNCTQRNLCSQIIHLWLRNNKYWTWGTASFKKWGTVNFKEKKKKNCIKKNKNSFTGLDPFLRILTNSFKRRYQPVAITNFAPKMYFERKDRRPFSNFKCDKRPTQN